MSNDIRTEVRDRYGKIAETHSSCCGSSQSSCCGGDTATDRSEALGYSAEDLAAIPDQANLGLGCGNPTAIASISDGEVVIDLGSGGGIDCFLASSKVGAEGRVIGVDMTPQMIERARENADKGGYENVDFRLGEIEHLPVADGTADVLISNCVINLSPDKGQVFAEAFRVLKPGGRMMISDVVLEYELPEKLRASLDLYAGCVAGAMVKDRYLDLIKSVGFDHVELTDERNASGTISPDDPTVRTFVEQAGLTLEEAKKLAGGVTSVDLLAVKSA